MTVKQLLEQDAKRQEQLRQMVIRWHVQAYKAYEAEVKRYDRAVEGSDSQAAETAFLTMGLLADLMKPLAEFTTFDPSEEETNVA